MFDIKRTATRNATTLFAGLFVLAVAMLLIMASADTAGAFDLTGRVEAVDHSAMTLTVRECGTSHLLSFAWDDKFFVNKDDMSLTFGDIKVGDEIDLAYYQESGGRYIAQDIAISASPAMKC